MWQRGTITIDVHACHAGVWGHHFYVLMELYKEVLPPHLNINLILSTNSGMTVKHTYDLQARIRSLEFHDREKKEL